MSRSCARAAAPAVLAGLVIGLVGALALVFRQTWLIPSLGPTIFLQLVNSAEPAARPRAILLGHAIGVAAGFGALFLCGAQDAPSVFGGQTLWPSRIAATAIAVSGTLFLQILARSKHPPAAATTMLITLGGVKPTWESVVAVGCGVTLIAALGQAARALSAGMSEAEVGAPARRRKEADVKPG